MARYKVLYREHPFFVEADEFKYSAESGVFVLLDGEQKVAVVPGGVPFYVCELPSDVPGANECCEKVTDG